MSISRARSLGKLYNTLAKAFPECRAKEHYGWEGNALDVHRLAQDMGVSDKILYKWFKEEKITARSAFKLIERANGQLTYEQIKKFIRH